MGVTAPSDDRSHTVADTRASARRVGDVGVTTGRIIAGRYEVRQLLGRGGMGVVFSAYDHALRDLVAIKVLRPELAAERCWVERLAREVRLARQVQHPNVCRVFDFVQVDGFALIVMELAQESLRAEHERAAETTSGGAAVPPTARLEMSLDGRLHDAAAIMAGLAAIHAAGIVHRDITLANILRRSDGRVAVSDFGLATDADATSASVHGGTVAYMAPELAFGVRASFASDVWALGVVLHEVVFGDRPSWHRSSDHHQLAVPARRMTAAEQTLFGICRRCLSLHPDARPRNGGAVEKLYLGGRDDRRRWRPLSRRLLLGASAFLVSTILATTVWNLPAGRPRTQAASPVKPESQPISVTGTPEDWTDTSNALVTVNGEIHCLAPLPDQRTIRFVWGSPHRAEDLDVVTGQRVPAPIAPKSYEEGCPDLSPDGRSLIFQGYDEDGRPHVFKSNAPDGSDARPIASSVMLSTTSEPRWLSNDEIVYNPDEGHVAIFELSRGRTVIIPGDSDRPSGVAGWRIIDEGSILTGARRDDRFQLRTLTWPNLRIQRSLTLIGPITDCVADPSAIYCSDPQEATLSRFDPDRIHGERVATIAGQAVTLLAVVGPRLIFVSRRIRSDAWLVAKDGKRRRLTDDGATSDAADCGAAGFLMAKHVRSGIDVVRVSPDGKREVLQTGAWDFAVECSKSSSDWWFARGVGDVGLFHCRESSCERIVAGGDIRWPSLSPDGARIAFFTYGTRGQSVKWLPSGGGPIHDVADSEGACGPGWSSPSTIWVSRRIRGRPLWTEVDADSGHRTGRTSPSANDCQGGYYGYPDPLSPVRPEIRIVFETTSQIRTRELSPAPPP